MEQSDKKHFFDKETFLLLGGGGMVGQQIAHEIARDLNPLRIIICALRQEEVDQSLKRLRADFPAIGITGVAGDVFVRREWNPTLDEDESKRRDNPPAPISRRQLLDSEEHREKLYKDVFESRGEAFTTSELVRLINKYKPDVIIDSINTATAFSYQDIYTASDRAKGKFDALAEAVRDGDGVAPPELVDSVGAALETVLISQSIPQLVRHVLLLNDAMRNENTRLYLKVGTTGTGGMGLNIPYTHSEDTPSATLMEKTAVAFAHTGLLYLMARTLDGPAIKEFKPAAMIGYADIRCEPHKSRGKIGVPGENLKLYSCRPEARSDGSSLRLRPAQDGGNDYKALGDMQLALVNTGENGFFTKGEFQAITYMGQMEFITPEEIARQVVMEVKGSNTGYDVIAAIDGASMNPTYRAGYLRNFAISELEELEKNGVPSVSLGELGPPQLGKLLWEAYLLHVVYRKRSEAENELEKVIAKSGDELSDEITAHLSQDERLCNTIVSVGFPILMKDGASILRGPYIRYPEVKNRDAADYGPGQWEAWAEKGWVDLRPSNMERWRARFEKMRREAGNISARGSAAFTREAYLSDWIKIGSVVGWIFNNEENFGHRIK